VTKRVGAGFGRASIYIDQTLWLRSVAGLLPQRDAALVLPLRKGLRVRLRSRK
jgi:hypothetical protein